MLSNEMDILEEIKAAILEPEPELKQIAELLKRSCGRKKSNYTTGPVIKPVVFEDNAQKQQAMDNILIVKALNNTSEPLSATIQVYNLGGAIPANDKTNKNLAVERQKVLFFSQTVEVQPQSTVFLPVDITPITEYEIQVLDASEGMYFATEFIPPSPIPTAQGSTTSVAQQTSAGVIDSHIVTYSHQFATIGGIV